MRHVERAHIRGLSRDHHSHAHRDRAAEERNHHAEAVGEASHEEAAHAEADHEHRVGRRRVGARHSELGLHRGQHHRHHVHAARAELH